MLINIAHYIKYLKSLNNRPNDVLTASLDFSEKNDVRPSFIFLDF